MKRWMRSPARRNLISSVDSPRLSRKTNLLGSGLFVAAIGSSSSCAGPGNWTGARYCCTAASWPGNFIFGLGWAQPSTVLCLWRSCRVATERWSLCGNGGEGHSGDWVVPLIPGLQNLKKLHLVSRVFLDYFFLLQAPSCLIFVLVTEMKLVLMETLFSEPLVVLMWVFYAIVRY